MNYTLVIPALARLREGMTLPQCLQAQAHRANEPLGPFLVACLGHPAATYCPTIHSMRFSCSIFKVRNSGLDTSCGRRSISINLCRIPPHQKGDTRGDLRVRHCLRHDNSFTKVRHASYAQCVIGTTNANPYPGEIKYRQAESIFGVIQAGKYPPLRNTIT